MSFLIYQIKRLVTLPFSLFSANSLVGGIWHESDRSRALLFGVPSIVCAILGILFVSWAEMSGPKSLENWYLNEVESSAEKTKEILTGLVQEARMNQATGAESSTPITTATVLDKVDDQDPRKQDFKNWSSKQEVFLEKLIELNPNEPEYRYQLAMLSYDKGDPVRALALLKMIASPTEPGHKESHLRLANHYMSQRVKKRSQLQRNLSLAMAHAEQCLKRDQENLNAKLIKGRLLIATNQFNDAYGVFDSLFKSDPRFFRTMHSLNLRRGRDSVNNDMLNEAIIKFTQQLNNRELEEKERYRIWSDLMQCYLLNNDFKTIERLLKKEEDVVGPNGERQIWVKPLLARVYLSWISQYTTNSLEDVKQRFELTKQAFKYDEDNPYVLREFVRLGNSDIPGIAEQAKSLYDPAVTYDAPALVLSEIGAQALARREYDLAIQYFEMARKKAPRSSEILNNLAYAFLVSTPPNPRRALTLVDEAIKYLPPRDGQQYLTFYQDTRGRALMELGEFEEAIMEFERARKLRPAEIPILEALVRCNRALKLDADADVYQSEIDRLKKQQNPSAKDR